MRLHLYLLGCLMSTAALAQDQIISKENLTIPCKIKSVSGQLVHYVNSFNDKPDSMATELVKELHYKDSLRVLVVPEAERDQVKPISVATFQNALETNNYALLLHAKAVRYDLTFVTPPNNRKILTLSADARTKLAPWLALAKVQQKASFLITIHTDTVGKAVVNQALAERQAAALRAHLASNGLQNNVTIKALGESEPAQAQQVVNRRVEFRCTAIKGVGILYAERYIPPKRVEPPVVLAAPTAPAQEYTRIQSAASSSKKPWTAIAYFEGLYTLQALSDDWVNPDKGPGILQGFGGGAMVTYFIKPRIGLTAQLGYSQWEVRRRYISVANEVQYTNDQTLGRLLIQVGARLYAVRSIYFQPMVGGQQFTLKSKNSETHPEEGLTTETKKFLPTISGAIGFEVPRKQFLFDVAAQYYLVPNKTFVGVAQSLHFVGLRLGVGFRSAGK